MLKFTNCKDYLFSFLQRPPMFCPTPQFYRLPKWAGAWRSVEYQKLFLISLSSLSIALCMFHMQVHSGFGAHIYTIHCNYLLYPNPSQGLKDQAQTCPRSRFPKLPLSLHHLIKMWHVKLNWALLIWTTIWVAPSIFKVPQSILKDNLTSTEATQASAVAAT